jgi:lysophospholipase L1-like esterase
MRIQASTIPSSVAGIGIDTAVIRKTLAPPPWAPLAPDPRPARALRRARRIIGALLGLHLLLAVFLVGQYPVLFRVAGRLLVPLADGDAHGMGVSVYRTVDPAGAGWRYVVPAASAQLNRPNRSLHAFAVWSPPAAGTYVLVFRADDQGAIFVDGHRVTGARAQSANSVARVAVPLGRGPHLLVVFLRNGPRPGWFSLEVQAPGDTSEGPLAPSQLHALNHRYVPYLWRAVERAGAWVRGPFFWLTLVLLAGAAAATWPATSGREAVLKGALILGGALIGLLVSEIGARLLLPAPTRVTFQTTSTAPVAGPRRDVFMIPTDRGFRHVPNGEVVVVHPATPDTPTLYRTNSLGYRNPEIGSKRAKRILFLGDSITLGLAVNEPDTFVRLVEGLARTDGLDWETINAGVNGLGTNGELAVLSETGLSVSPDLVVLGFYLNDFLESPGIYVTRLPGLLDRSVLAHPLANLAFPFLYLAPSERDELDSAPMLKPPDEIHAWQEEFRRSSTVLPAGRPAEPGAVALQEEVLRHFDDWGGAFSPHVWAKLEGLLGEFVRLSTTHRFRFAVVAFPVRHQVEAPALFDYPQRRLREITRALGVPLLDLLPPLRDEQARSGTTAAPMFFDQCHLTPRGSRIVASVVYEFLRDSAAANRPTGG